MVGRTRKAAATILVAFLFMPLAQAEEGDYQSEYALYVAAIEAGDRQAAASHGLAAWRAAEDALGDDAYTAILAYNYGQFVLFSDAPSAAEALRRANALQEAGIADLPVSHLRVYLAYAEFEVEGGSRPLARELQDALLALEGEGAAPSANLTFMWMALTGYYNEQERYEETLESARKAEAYIEVTAPDNYPLKATMILLQGEAQLIPFPRTIEDIRAAYDAFIRARALFPPQEDIENFDETMARIMAWDLVARAAAASMEEPLLIKYERIDEVLPWAYFKTPQKSDEECEIAWKKRKPPRYPETPLWEGFIGGVVIGYHLGDDALVHDARILAEVPEAAFGKAALESMKDWRLAAPALNDPACRRNRIVDFIFIIKD
jgi:tetratricopeptide (TPR) repeat protein